MTPEDLTLVIVTKDRPKYLVRLLDYLVEQDCPFPVLLTDGSTCDYHLDYKPYVRCLPKLEILERSSDTTTRDFFRRALYAFDGVQTPYAMWLCDDDFPVVAGLREGLERLGQDAASCGVMGAVHDFYVDVCLRAGCGCDQVWGHLYMSDREFELSGRYRIRKDIVGQQEKRVSKAKYLFPMEMIAETAVWRAALRALCAAGSDSPRNLIWAVRFAALLSGDVLSVRDHFLLHQANPVSSQGSLQGREEIEDPLTELRPDVLGPTIHSIAHLVGDLTPAEEKEAVLEVALKSLLEYRYRELEQQFQRSRRRMRVPLRIHRVLMQFRFRSRLGYVKRRWRVADRSDQSTFDWLRLFLARGISERSGKAVLDRGAN